MLPINGILLCISKLKPCLIQNFLVAQNAVHKLKSPEHDLWSLSSRKARAALRDNVRRVLLSSPQEYGEMKLEVMAWQYGVHQVIARVKKEIKELHAF